MLLVRDVRAVKTGDADEDTTDDNDDDTSGGTKPRPKRAGSDPVTAMLRRHRDWGDDKIAAKCGVSKRTVQRRRSDLDKAEAAAGTASKHD